MVVVGKRKEKRGLWVFVCVAIKKGMGCDGFCVSGEKRGREVRFSWGMRER